jgi:hypothetical protein
MASEDGSGTNSTNAACYKHGVNMRNFVTCDTALYTSHEIRYVCVRRPVLAVSKASSVKVYLTLCVL